MLADANLDEQWLKAHRGIESVGYGSGGAMQREVLSQYRCHAT
jgi:hypothetical protein